MQNPKIVFFDIDDTIYRKYTDTLRPSVGEALAALKQRGILTAIATGRPPVAIPAKVKALIQEVGIDMLVTINGQYIEFQGKTLQHYPMVADEAAAVCNFLAQQNIAYAFVNNAEIAVSEETEWAKECLIKNCLVLSSGCPLLPPTTGVPIIGFLHTGKRFRNQCRRCPNGVQNRALA